MNFFYFLTQIASSVDHWFLLIILCVHVKGVIYRKYKDYIPVLAFAYCGPFIPWKNLTLLSGHYLQLLTVFFICFSLYLCWKKTKREKDIHIDSSFIFCYFSFLLKIFHYFQTPTKKLILGGYSLKECAMYADDTTYLYIYHGRYRYLTMKNRQFISYSKVSDAIKFSNFVYYSIVYFEFEIEKKLALNLNFCLC